MSHKRMINIALESMKFHACHGFYDEEKKTGRSFLVSVFLDCEVEIDGTDQLADTYNYEWIYEVVSEEMNTPRKLLETVAFHISQKLINKSSVLKSGTIKIEKLGLPALGNIAKATISFPF